MARCDIDMEAADAFIQEVLEMKESVETGTVDPLNLHLTNSYQKLQQLALEIDDRIHVDEILNAVLGIKVTKVEELVMMMITPELYLTSIKNLKANELAKLVSYRHPVIISSLGPDMMTQSLEKMMHFASCRNQEMSEDAVPGITTLPDNFRFRTEDSVFLADLECFVERIPKNTGVKLSEIVRSMIFDEFLKRFLYVVILIARGALTYDASTSLVRRV